jgi:hypothetical protein
MSHSFKPNLIGSCAIRSGPKISTVSVSVEPVLTVRQPFASAILLAGKDIENRSWRTHYRGRLWIHSAVQPRRREWPAAKPRGLWLPEEPLPRRVILGCVELADCLWNADSPWAVRGQWHWLLRRPMLLRRPVPQQGRPGLCWRRPPQGQLSRARNSRRAEPQLRQPRPPAT